jgi:hypothetical protein
LEVVEVLGLSVRAVCGRMWERLERFDPVAK